MRRAVFLVFFPIFALAQVESAANSAQPAASNLPLVWMCSVKPFNKKFEALGASRAEARMNARELCKKDHNEMHCESSVICEGPSNMQPLGWTCTLSPTSKRLMATAVGRVEAKFKVQALCKAEASEILCQNPVCTEG